MYAGRLVETGPTEVIYAEPKHPYTWACSPRCRGWTAPGRQSLRVIKGLPPNLARLPKGCPFAPRCDYAMDRCREEKPPLEKVGEDHYRACFYDAGS